MPTVSLAIPPFAITLPGSVPVSAVYPHLACSGLGTEVSPWTHADNTAGIQTAINAIAAQRGGTVILAPGVYTVATPISITTNGITIEAGSGGFNNDAVSPPSAGLQGTKLLCAGTGIVMSGTAKLTNLTFRGLYLYGPGESGNSSIGISATCAVDNIVIDRCNVQAFGSGGIILAGGSDAGKVISCSILYCGTGVGFAGSTGGVNSIIGSTVADNAGIGIIVNDGIGGAIIANNIIGRNANGLGTPVVNGCNIYLDGGGINVLSGNQIYDAGDDIYFGHGVVAAQNVVVVSNQCNICGNAIYGTQNGSGILVKSTVAGLTITGNSWTGGGSGGLGPNSAGSVTVEVGATGIAIDNPQLTHVPTLLNSWDDLGSGFATAAYWIDSTGTVHLDGVLKSGTPGAGSVAFVLPAGYRPTTTKVFACGNGDSGSSSTPNTLVFIDSAGNVTAEVGPTTWFSLAGVSFLAGT